MHVLVTNDKQALRVPVTRWAMHPSLTLGFAFMRNVCKNSVLRTQVSSCRWMDGWGPNFCAQNCEAHRWLHQQYPRGSRRLA
jgi:hypothetical protein